MLGQCISSFFPASPEPISRSVRQNRFKSVAGLVGSLGTKQNDKSEVVEVKYCGFKIGSVDTMLYANFENNFEKAVFWYLRF